MAEKDEDKGIERIYVIPLRKIKRGKSSIAAPKAIKHVREYLKRHMKVKEEDIWIDASLNTTLWSRGKYKIPSKIRVRAVKFEDGVVEVSLPELGYKKSRRELLKEEREKKEPILRREEAEGEEGEGIGGAEDYEVAPAADGDVKIKKKKAHKPKKESEEKPKKKPVKKKEEPVKEPEMKPAAKKTAAAKKKTPTKKTSTAKKPARKKPAAKKK
jgi:large subunit ribosomal protein L31e